jgi:hypothetical protein
MGQRIPFTANENEENDLRRLALQLVVQLPASNEDALRVLDLARVFVNDFLAPPKSEAQDIELSNWG